jgi:isoleucyl-tRNA synthetase
MTDTAQKKNYKDTLNLPQTSFAMEAKLVQNEPLRLQKWQEMNLYGKLMDARSKAPQWILHDGPPFANGDIHIGHLINKTLKDVVQRFRSMQGHQTPYVPGWDCHGLPIEHKIQEKLGPKIRELPTSQVRQECFDYAAKYAKIQSEQFQRLGILGDWAHPYLTMAPEYEASTLEVFARFVENGLVYKKLKPVPWSISNQTALADAELEYKDVEDVSIYVEFPAVDSAKVLDVFRGMGGSPMQSPTVSFLVWTTTPWTLPANLAIAVHPEVKYALVRYSRAGQERFGVAAEDLVKTVFGRKGIENYEVVATTTGRALVDANLQYNHPFVPRTGRILPALYVTTTDGTGLVHTAPGHGEDDYATGITHGLNVYCPVLHNGRFDDSVPEYLRGLNVFDANPVIITHLRDANFLFDESKIVHSYPHDWRSKKPVILRATEQWFISVDKPFIAGSAVGSASADVPRSLRNRALDAINTTVEFIPDWGKARIAGMLESRPDWCISRQRAWGLPIPVFYNDKGEALLTPDSVRAVAKRFAEKGSNAWFTDSPADLLGDYDPGPTFPKDKLRKEKDIFDVWFESGSSWNAVLRARPSLKFPCEMYLEGSDQHRGWFQLSLLTALGATGLPPFKQVLTHGFIVKPDGTKVSKSDKEYVTATQEINRHGADLLRLWCCSVDYQNDIPASPKVLQEFGDKYRKIRNTLRYLLSNLYDYTPADAAAVGAAVGAASAASLSSTIPQNSLDGWASDQLDTLITDVTDAYEHYQLHRAFRLLHDFCAVQFSAIYGNAMKDRLYCEAPDSPIRRRCQAVMHRTVLALTKLLAPMLVFTADETWEHIPHKPAADADLPSIHLALLPKPSGDTVSEKQREEWKLLMQLRDQALLQLDTLKKQAGVNKALETEIVYHVDDDELRRDLQAYGQDLEDLVGAGHHALQEEHPEGPAVTVRVIDRRETYKACARSWKRRPDVGDDPEYPDLSLRDAKAMRAIGK